MKELSIEEKAKAYDKVSKEVKDFFEGRRKMFSDVTRTLEYLFPELKESEDERIRKELIDAIRGLWDNDALPMPFSTRRKDEWLAWLEKQGGQKPNPYSGVSFEYNAHTWGMCGRDGGVEISIDSELKAFVSLDKSFIYPIHNKSIIAPKSALEAIKEEKVDNANKVEPKFHEGDWIVDMEDGELFYISRVLDSTYELVSTNDGDDYHMPHYTVDDNYRLWTIQDAKAGDVIYLPNGNNEYYFFIFKEIKNAAVMSFAHFYQYNNGTSEVEGTIDNLSSVNDVFRPATKGQRDFLFSKIKENGYVWDADKKELKR